jgi:hypothetical protein
MSESDPNEGREPEPRDDSAELKAFTKILMQVIGLIHEVPAQLRPRLFRSLSTVFDFADSGPVLPTRPTSPHSTSMGPSPSQPTFSEDRAPSPKQFLLDKKPQTDIERIACLAYYLTHYRDTPSYKTLDLSKLNTEAAQVKFSNAAKAVDNASKTGWLVQSGGGRKQISAVGELYVQALPDRAAARDAVAHARPRKSRTRPKSSSGSQTPEN